MSSQRQAAQEKRQTVFATEPADHGAPDPMMQVRNLLFGEAQSRLQTDLERQNQNLAELRADFDERLTQTVAEFNRLLTASNDVNEARIAKIGELIASLGHAVTDLGRKR